MNWRDASLSPPTLKSRGVERVDDSSLLALLTFYFADEGWYERVTSKDVENTHIQTRGTKDLSYHAYIGNTIAIYG